MLCELFDVIGVDDGRTAIWSTEGEATWSDLATEYRSSLSHFHDLTGCRVGLAFSASSSGFAALAALERLETELFLIDQETETDELTRLAKLFDLEAVVAPQRFSAPMRFEPIGSRRGTSSIMILTSGTSGRPKAVRHDWAKLARPVRRVASSDQVWLMAFRPHLYAGVQVALQALQNQGTLVVPSLSSEPDDIARLMAKARVEYASATPSYWRRLLYFAPRSVLESVPLKQITLGGEVVDQTTLDRLAEIYPLARIVHIYATTELGRCFSVADGQAGFPASWLGKELPDGVELQMRDAELWIKSANSMVGYVPTESHSTGMPEQEGWFATGDRIVLVNDRIYFTGRTTEIINVGGSKVQPVEVERVIREVNGIAEVRVYGQKSSIAGQLVACQIVPTTDVDGELLRQSVIQHCHAKLNRYQIPRIVQVVNRLDLSRAGKISRQ